MNSSSPDRADVAVDRAQGVGMPPLTVRALPGLPEVVPGDDLAALIAEALADEAAAADDGRAGLGLDDGRAGVVVVVSSKIVSKALGLRVSGTKEDVVAGQTLRVVAERRTAGLPGATAPGHVVRVVESLAGPVMVAAGVDASNTGDADLLLLPTDPDGEAARLRDRLLALLGLLGRGADVLGRGADVLGRGADVLLGVVISDTAGRPWRSGQVDFALGSAGVHPFLDHRGESDRDGRELAVTVRCLVDELAAAADLVKGKADGTPVALVTGCPADWFDPDAAGARSVVRTGPGDWFALGHVEAVRAALGIRPGSTDSAAVGIPPTVPDGFPERLGRALTLALYSSADDSSADDIGADDVGADDVGANDIGADVEVRSGENWASVHLSGGDEFRLGRALARLEVAAWSEGLTVTPPEGAEPTPGLHGVHGVHGVQVRVFASPRETSPTSTPEAPL